jgi:hypothetical protein
MEDSAVRDTAHSGVTVTGVSIFGIFVNRRGLRLVFLVRSTDIPEPLEKRK